MRFFSVALVALGATQPDVDLDPATRNRLYWGPDSLYIPVYMIAPTKLYTKRQEALRELGLEPNQVRPHNFHVEEPPCYPTYYDGTASTSAYKWAELGCFESHRDAWKRIAAGERIGLVLEADWTIANQSAHVLKHDFRRLVSTMHLDDIDLMWAGKCEIVYCTTAYFVKPAAAKILAESSMCDKHLALDHFMPHECGRKPGTTAVPAYSWDRKEKYDQRISCRKAKFYNVQYPVEYFPGLYGDEGPFYQDRRVKGMHQRDAKHWNTTDPPPEAPHETYAQLGERVVGASLRRQ
jgi:hypothetical protein